MNLVIHMSCLLNQYSNLEILVSKLKGLALQLVIHAMFFTSINFLMQITNDTSDYLRFLIMGSTDTSQHESNYFPRSRFKLSTESFSLIYVRI